MHVVDSSRVKMPGLSANAAELQFLVSSCPTQPVDSGLRSFLSLAYCCFIRQNCVSVLNPPAPLDKRSAAMSHQKRPTSLSHNDTSIKTNSLSHLVTHTCTAAESDRSFSEGFVPHSNA